MEANLSRNVGHPDQFCQRHFLYERKILKIVTKISLEPSAIISANLMKAQISFSDLKTVFSWLDPNSCQSCSSHAPLHFLAFDIRRLTNGIQRRRKGLTVQSHDSGPRQRGNDSKTQKSCRKTRKGPPLSIMMDMLQ